MIQYVSSIYCVDNLFIVYLSLKRNPNFKHNFLGTFGISCGMFSNVISLMLKDSDMDSENVTLIRRWVSDGKKLAKGVSLIGTIFKTHSLHCKTKLFHFF